MGPRQLAAAIRKGHTMIGEARDAFLVGKCGCALGAAMVASGRSEQEYWNERFAGNLDAYQVSAKFLCADLTLVKEISRQHWNGTPRLAIADWLDSLEPAQRQTFDDFLAATLKAVEVPMDSDTTARTEIT